MGRFYRGRNPYTRDLFFTRLFLSYSLRNKYHGGFVYCNFWFTWRFGSEHAETWIRCKGFREYITGSWWCFGPVRRLADFIAIYNLVLLCCFSYVMSINGKLAYIFAILIIEISLYMLSIRFFGIPHLLFIFIFSFYTVIIIKNFIKQRINRFIFHFYIL